MFVQVCFEASEVVVDIGILHDIVAGERRHWLHTEEAKVHVHGEKQVIDGFALEQILVRVVKCFPGSIVLS